MKIGIISGCIGEKTKGRLRKIQIIEYDNFTVAQLPFNPSELSGLSKKKLGKLMNKAEFMLHKNNVDRIIPADELRERPFELSEIFYTLANKAVIGALQYFNIRRPFKLYIKERYPDEKMLAVIEKLIFDIRGIGLLTDKEKGVMLADKILRKFGELPEIKAYECVPRDGVTVNLDENSILISGKWKLYNFSCQENMRGYNVDGIEFHFVKFGKTDKIQITGCRFKKIS